MQKRSELFFNVLLLPIDFIAVVGGFVLAYIIRVKIENKPVSHPLGALAFLKLLLLVVPIWILIFALSGLYNLSGLRGRLDELGKVFVAVSGGTMFLILIDFASKQPLFPAKAIPFYGYGLSLVLVLLGRQIVRAIQRGLFNFGVGVHQAVLVGSGPVAQQVAEGLRTGRSGYRLIALIEKAKNASKRVPGLPTYTSLDEFIAHNKGRHVDEIIQADAGFDPDEILEMVNYASNHHLTYRFVPNQFGIFAVNSSVSNVAGLPMIELKHTPLEGWGRIVKRTFDILGALVGLIVFSPVFLLVAIASKIVDPGPVLYRHKRLSRVGKTIFIYKFRSMYLKYCTGPGYSGKTDAEVLADDLGRPELATEFAKEQKLNDDPRVHSLGRFLRKTSLDELPQFLNVLRGDLSLVGPRPIIEAELERYGTGQSAFLALKPGLTGLWQISGRSDLGYEERVKLDIYYIENWSLFLDIKILVKTALSVLGGRGAY
ncbi:MAG TPA: sugar transferase [Candidatus Nanoarchaeia archaeon]|nr:sugar transferase [Candidatus Nanoarchaeia archaeon]